MRVAMIAPARPDCGIGDYARELSVHLRDRVDLRLVPVEEISDADGPVPPALDVDLVHLQYEHAFFLQRDDPAGSLDRLLSGLRTPVLVTLHCLPLEDPRWSRWLRHPRLAYHVLSRWHRERLLAMGPEARVTSTLHPVPPRTPATETAERFRDAQGLGDLRILAMFGFVKAHKGYDVAVEALASLPEDVGLLVAGGPQDAEGRETLAAIRRQASELGVDDRVFVSGYLDPARVGTALTTAELVLAPFHALTASGSVATALAWERPVVATAHPQFLEIEERFGTPHCVPVGATADLAAAIRRLLDDESATERLVAGARRARAEAGYEGVAAACVDAYRDLVGTVREATP